MACGFIRKLSPTFILKTRRNRLSLCGPTSLKPGFCDRFGTGSPTGSPVPRHFPDGEQPAETRFSGWNRPGTAPEPTTKPGSRDRNRSAGQTIGCNRLPSNHDINSTTWFSGCWIVPGFNFFKCWRSQFSILFPGDHYCDLYRTFAVL